METPNQTQLPKSLYLNDALGLTWRGTYELLSESTMGKMLASNPPRWITATAENPELAKAFQIRPELLPKQHKVQAQSFGRENLNDSNPAEHLRVTQLIGQAYIADNHKAFPELKKDKNVSNLMMVLTTHDLQEAVVGDFLSGTKTEEDDILEQQSYKYSMQRNIAGIGLVDEHPLLEKQLQECVSIMIADPKFDGYFDRQPKNIPNRVNFQDHLEDRVTEVNRQLHEHYKNIHLVTFLLATLSAKLNNPSSEKLANLKDEVWGSRTGQIVKIANGGNEFFLNFLETNQKHL